MAETDRVLVVGAGPVGLVAAMALADAGIPVTVIEASPDLPEDLRASTFHPPTLDMLDRFGMAEICIAQGLICPNWQFRDRREGVIATFDLGLLADETAHPYRVQCEQWKLTRALRDRLAGRFNVDIRYNARALSHAQDDTGVTLTIEEPDGLAVELRGRYLIAADGARSVIRKNLGVEFPGMTIPELYLTASTSFRFEQVIPDLVEIAYISDPKEWLVLLRTPTLWRVLLPTDAELTDEAIVAPETIEARLQEVVPHAGTYEVIHRTAYRVHDRVADSYVQGRVFLAGDAAHLNNPLGGMGMNGGIHDAINLTDKLSQVWHGAKLDLMGRYERQRRKVAIETVQAQSMRNRTVLNERDPAKRRAYHDELRGIAADPVAHRAYMLRSSMLQSLRDLESVA